MIKKLTFANTLIVLGVGLIAYATIPYIYEELYYDFLQWRGTKYVLTENDAQPDLSQGRSIFGQIMSKKEIAFKPVNNDFALIIEKIGVNVPVVMGVSVSDEGKYNEALKTGVAHAITSDLPSEYPGNTYIFAHSSLNFWSLGKYATAFNLVRKLQNNDEINVFYHGKRYIYTVVNKETLPGWNTYPLTRKVIEPILTLQTCDPPGTTLNRLVITAKLKQVL